MLVNLSVMVKGNVDYLVIYHDILEDNEGWEASLTQLLESQGHILLFHSISDGTTSDQIKSTIEQYSIDYSRLRYVLLVGIGKDNPTPDGGDYPVANQVANSEYGNLVPYSYYLGHLNWQDEERDIPSDKNYAFDLSLVIGRVPAETVTDVRIWVSKLSEYYTQFTKYRLYNNPLCGLT
jgi:hypothetical protein